MGLTDIERRALKGGAQIALATPNARGLADPIALRIPDAIRLSGLSRSEIYRRASRGEIVLLKCGRSTLVEYASLRAMMASLPRAAIGTTNSAI